MKAANAVFETLPSSLRVGYALAIASKVLREIDQPLAAYAARAAVAGAARWRKGCKVTVDELCDLTHDEQDKGLEIFSQQAHVERWTCAPAINAVLYAVSYVTWRASLLTPPVASLLDNASEAMLGELEVLACSCQAIDHAVLQNLAASLLVEKNA